MIGVGMPVFNDIEFIVLRVGKQVVEVVRNQHIEVEKEHPLSGKSAEGIITESGFFAVGEMLVFRPNKHGGFGVLDDLRVQCRKRLVTKKVECDRNRSVSLNH